MVIASHYQKPLEFSFEALDQAEATYLKLKNKISSLSKEEQELDEEKFREFDNKFKETLDNNLNTSLSLTVLSDVLKSNMNDYTKRRLIENFDKVLSLDLLEEDNSEIPSEVLELVEKRNNYKQEKNYQEADLVREEIAKLGYKILDTRDGVKIEKL